MQPSPRTGPARPAGGDRGFTIVELLIVLGIILVLIGTLLPVVSMARVSAARTQSASNLRQIGVALIQYTGKHRGQFPEVTHGLPPSRSWIYSLAPYLANVDRIRLCPLDPQYDRRLAIGGTSYVMNEYVTLPLVDPFGQVLEDYTRIQKLRRSSESVMAFVSADGAAVSISSDHTHSRSWFGNMPAGTNWKKICVEMQPDRFSARPNAEKSNGTTLFLYADGHVQTHRAADLKRSADAGINFAKPPR